MLKIKKQQPTAGTLSASDVSGTIKTILPTKIKMRDKRFIAEHRGWPLKKEQHRQLIKWACDCAENVLPLFGEKLDERLKNALLIAKEWAKAQLANKLNSVNAEILNRWDNTWYKTF